MRYFLMITMLFLFGVVYANTSQGYFTQDGNASRYASALSQLNALLEDFNDGYYGQVEVVDEYIIIRFQEGKYSKFKIADMADPVLDIKYDQVTWDCRNSSNCVLTDWNEEGVESGILFQEMGSSNLGYLLELLSNFISAYRSK